MDKVLLDGQDIYSAVTALTKSNVADWSTDSSHMSAPLLSLYVADGIRRLSCEFGGEITISDCQSLRGELKYKSTNRRLAEPCSPSYHY
jgi:hypothetical protein